MGYKLNKLILRRFGPHLETVFEPTQNELTMIYGENLDDDGADSNGSGKSWLYEAITKLIVGRTFKQRSKDELIMNGEDDAEIEGFFTNGEEQLHIYKKVQRKGSEVIKVYENGIENKKAVKLEKYIWEEKFGIEYDDFVNYFVVGQRNLFSFFAAGDAYIKKLIERFADDDVLVRTKESMEERFGELDKEREKHIDTIIKCRTKIEVFEEQVKDIKEGQEKKNREEVERLNKEIKSDKELRSELKQDIRDIKKEIEKQETKVSELESVDIGDLENDVKKAKKKEKEALGKYKEMLDKASHYRAMAKERVECPHCGEDFSLSDTESKLTKEQAQEKQKECEKKAEKLSKVWMAEKKELSEKRSLLDEHDEDELEEVQDVLENQKEKLKRVKARLKRCKESIIEKNDKVVKLKEEIKTGVYDNELVEHTEEKIEKRKATIKKENKALKKTEKEYESLDYWLKYGLKGFKAHLFNNVLAAIEGQTNIILEKLHTSLSIRLYGFKINKDGSLTEKVTCIVYRNGNDIGNYRKLSGGEAKRIDLCGTKAIRDIINENLPPEQGFDFWALDEIFEGLDKTGSGEVVKMLDNIGETVCATSHLISDFTLPNDLIVSKKKEIAKII